MILHGHLILCLTSFSNLVTLFGISHTAPMDGSYQYMVELYRRSRNEKTNLMEKTSTTVRSILPTRGNTKLGEEVLVYNLTSVPTTETIVKAELHVHIRSKKPKTHGYFLNLWDPTSPSSLPLEQYRIGKEVGWTVYDVLQAVLKCKDRREDERSFIGVSMRGNSDGKKPRPPSTKRLAGPHSQPFLVIFSEDKLSNPSTTGMFQAHLSDIASFVNSRRKRSLQDNNLTENPVYQSDGMSVTPVSNSYERRSRPLQGSGGTKSKRQGDKKDRRRLRKQRFLRAKLNENDVTVTDYEETGIGICRKKKLEVKLKELGWSDGIIAPIYIELGYCSGQCPLQLAKNISWSNHATLQSLVHALKLDPDVPPPCCVPDVMSSLSMLFLDQMNNFILKTYSKMIVRTCGCR